MVSRGRHPRDGSGLEGRHVERRKAPRYKRRLGVSFWSQEQPEPKKGFTLNLSHRGVFIATFVPFSVGTWITLELPLGERTIHLEGLVRSSFRVDPALRKIKQSGMGVQLLKTEELIQGVLKPKEDKESDSSDRVDSDAATLGQAGGAGESAMFSVYINTPMDLEEMFDRHIQHGGVYVPTPGVARVKERVGVQFLFDWSPETVIQASGKVVKTFAATGSSKNGGELAGIGIAFSSPGETISHFQQVLATPDLPAADASSP